MFQYTIIGIILAVSYLVFYLINLIVSSYRHAQNSRRLGCEAPHIRQNHLPLGMDHVMRLNKADKRDRVPDEFVAIYNEEQHDTFVHWFTGHRHVFTCNPKNIQAILATQFQDFQLGDQRRNSFFPMLGTGIFTADGKAWEHSRAILRPQFTRQQVADLELEETHVQHMLKHLESTDASGWTSAVDLGPLFFRLTIDSATEFLFGQSVQSQLQALPGSNDRSGFDWKSLADSFDRGTASLGQRGRLGDAYWLHNPKHFREDCKEVQRFADHFVHQALQRTEYEEKTQSPVDGKKRYVFLHELIKVTKDPVELRCQLLHILLAGRDTTAGLLGWTCWSLARNPAVFQKLRTTILETFGTYERPQEITFERLKSCSYLQHVMNETLRLFPSVPLNARQATRDTSLPCGGGPDGSSPVYIKKGEDVGYSVYVMQRRKDLWGPDAEKFNPERWLGRRPGWEYLPFNGGPRICLGQQFALTEAGYVLTRLIQKYDRIEACDALEEPRHQYSVTSAPRRVMVKLHS